MKGLLLKDFYSLKKYIKTMAIMLIFYGIIGANSDSPSFIGGMIILFFSMLTLTTFSYDEAAHWEQFALGLPVSRKKLILSKYVLTLILTITGGMVSIVLISMISIINNSLIMGDILLTTYGVIVVAIMMMSVLLPLIEKFGVEKGRLMIIAVFIIPFGIIMLLNYLNVPMPSDTVLIKAAYFSPLIIILFMAISYFVSCKIIEHKEF